MIKGILILATLSLGLTGFGQPYLKMDTSYVHFFSEAPAEDIEALNNKANGLINTKTNDIALIIPIKSFKFDKELMEEHFNENYLESDKYKNGSFKGKFNEKINWTADGSIEATATGILNIHGVEQKRTIKGQITIKDGKALLNTKFQVKLVDHDIDIPKVVFYNIAEVIDVTARLYFTPKQ